MSLGTARERENLYEFTTAFLKSKKVGMVLDVACDYGLGTKILAEELSANIVGVDIEASAIAIAKSQYSAPNITYKEGDARHMDFPDSTFDAVISMHTIEHLNEQDQALFVCELARVLKPAGWLLIATPDGEVWKLQGIANMQEGHMKELSRMELEGVLKKNGFAVHQAYGQWVLKRGETFVLRRVLNLLKKIDAFRLRRFLGKKIIDDVDQKTQPVELDDRVLPLRPDQKASVNVLVCTKK